MLYSPDGRTIATITGAFEGSAPDDAVIKTLPCQTRPVRAVFFSPDDQTLASAGRDGAVRFWDVVIGELRRTFVARSPQGVAVLAISPDGKWLAASTWMGGVVL